MKDMKAHYQDSQKTDQQLTLNFQLYVVESSTIPNWRMDVVINAFLGCIPGFPNI